MENVSPHVAASDRRTSTTKRIISPNVAAAAEAPPQEQPTGLPVWVGATTWKPAVAVNESSWNEVSRKPSVHVYSVTEKTLSEIPVTQLQPRDTKLGVPNCTELGYLNLPNLLANVEQRFTNAINGQEEGTYTSVGWLLLAVNPYRPCPALYSRELINQFVGKPYFSSPPHPFAVAECTYSTLLKTWRNQSVVISGESGAGKTECSKHVLRYLALLSDERHDGKLRGIENRILQSNPILEAFGNAKTIRNNNSSRFGKLMKLHFSKDGKIKGASIMTYLLAKSRVCHVPSQERNYHVFYWMCRSLRDTEREQLHIRPWHEYRCLKATDEEHDQNAAWPTAAFHGLRQAMSAISQTVETQMEIFRVLSLILSLGNLTFTVGSDGRGRFERNPDTGKLCGEVLVTCSLLGLDTEELHGRFEETLTGRKIVDTTKHHTQKESQQAAESVCRALYQRLFDYIVSVINTNLRDWHKLKGGSSSGESTKYIGILDIFGFEDLEPCSPNNFEQLCINYTNEKLHNFFVETLVKADIALYTLEGLTPPPLSDDADSGQLCRAIAGSKTMPGIFQYLEEASVIAGKAPPDEIFCRRINSTLSSRVIQPSLRRDKASQQFTINHFAGPVVYTAAGFTFRNTDFLTADIRQFLASVPNVFIARELFGPELPLSGQAILSTESDSGDENAKGESSITETSGAAVTGGVSAPTLRSSTALSGYGGGGLAGGPGDEKISKRAPSVPPPSRGPPLPDRPPGGLFGSRCRQWSRSGGSGKTIVSLFSSQVEDLMRTLGKSHAFFIRCIKPNNSQTARLFDADRVFRQLKSGGVLGVLEVMGKGHPCRISHAELWDRFKHMLPPSMQATVGPREFAKAVLVFLKASPDEYRIGATKAFFRFGQLQELENIAALTDEAEKERFVQEMYVVWRRRKLRKTLSTVHAATRLHCCAKRARARVQAAMVFTFYHEILVPAKRGRAATILQRWWRGVIDQRLELEQELLRLLVLRLQALWRGICARRMVAGIRALVSMARARYEAVVGVCEWQALRLSACYLQSYARTALLRKELTDIALARSLVHEALSPTKPFSALASSGSATSSREKRRRSSGDPAAADPAAQQLDTSQYNNPVESPAQQMEQHVGTYSVNKKKIRSSNVAADASSLDENLKASLAATVDETADQEDQSLRNHVEAYSPLADVTWRAQPRLTKTGRSSTVISATPRFAPYENPATPPSAANGLQSPIGASSALLQPDTQFPLFQSVATTSGNSQYVSSINLENTVSSKLSLIKPIVQSTLSPADEEDDMGMSDDCYRSNSPDIPPADASASPDLPPTDGTTPFRQPLPRAPGVSRSSRRQTVSAMSGFSLQQRGRSGAAANHSLPGTPSDVFAQRAAIRREILLVLDNLGILKSKGQRRSIAASVEQIMARSADPRSSIRDYGRNAVVTSNILPLTTKNLEISPDTSPRMADGFGGCESDIHDRQQNCKPYAPTVEVDEPPSRKRPQRSSVLPGVIDSSNVHIASPPLMSASPLIEETIDAISVAARRSNVRRDTILDIPLPASNRTYQVRRESTRQQRALAYAIEESGEEHNGELGGDDSSSAAGDDEDSYLLIGGPRPPTPRRRVVSPTRKAVATTLSSPYRHLPSSGVGHHSANTYRRPLADPPLQMLHNQSRSASRRLSRIPRLRSGEHSEGRGDGGLHLTGPLSNHCIDPPKFGTNPLTVPASRLRRPSLGRRTSRASPQGSAARSAAGTASIASASWYPTRSNSMNRHAARNYYL